VKKYTILILIIFLVGQTVFAQSNNSLISVGIGPEFNMNAPENFAGGLAMSIDYLLPIYAINLAVGLGVTYSDDFQESYALETGAFVRWYFLDRILPGLFAQLDLGVVLIPDTFVEDILFGAGLRAGIRIPLSNSIYIEPYGRMGYPFAWGIGVLGGFRFNLSSNNSGGSTGSTYGNVGRTTQGDE